MKTLKLGISYLVWHYTLAFADIFRNAKNILWFLYYFFSIPILTKTFFAPWKRLDVHKNRGESAADKFGRFIINSIMRVVGMMFRASLIFVGMVLLVLAFLCEIVLTLLWICLPVLIVFFFIKGLILIF